MPDLVNVLKIVIHCLKRKQKQLLYLKYFLWRKSILFGSVIQELNICPSAGLRGSEVQVVWRTTAHHHWSPDRRDSGSFSWAAFLKKYLLNTWEWPEEYRSYRISAQQGDACILNKIRQAFLLKMENLYAETGLGTIRRQRSNAPEIPHKLLKGKCVLTVQQHYMTAHASCRNIASGPWTNGNRHTHFRTTKHNMKPKCECS